MFTEPEFSTAQVDYSGYTLDAFKADKRAYAELIIDQVGPDYHTAMNEPVTMVPIAPGLSDLNQPAKYREILDYVTSGLDRKGVLIGAGAGSWEDPSTFEVHSPGGRKRPGLHRPTCLPAAARFLRSNLRFH